MSELVIVELSRLREIGWREWDPIGLVDTDCPRDEYDRYLVEAINRLKRGDSVYEVADYLDGIGVEWMGIGPSTPASRASAETTAIQIKAYLDTLPPGPLKVR
jgi:hypothetical protein